MRRAAFLALLISQILILSIIFKRTASPISTTTKTSASQRTKLSSSLNVDPNASLYKPSPPTAAQNVEYDRLKSLIESRSSSYNPALFEAKKSANSRIGRHLEGVKVTAVILHWKRKRGLDLIIQQMSRYPYIREIIVWNNRGIDLTHSVSFRSPY